MVATRLAERSLGLISTLIIARLLTPEDFGIVAIAMIAVMFFDILSKTGAEQYIVQKTEVSSSDLNTAWTLNLLLKFVLFSFIFLFSSSIASFYDDVRLEYVLIAISLMAPIHAFSNPGLFLQAKEQNYKTIAKLAIIKKLISIVITVSIALIYQNYWALILGQLAGSISHSFLSYIFIKYRPSFDVSKIAEQWGFSKWMLLKEILGFLRSQSDMILVGKFFSTSSMGGYHLSKYISSMPTTELIQPALAPLLASFSKNKSNRAALLYQVELVVIVISIIIVPVSIYLYFFSSQLVALILGDQWKEFHAIFGILALVGISSEIVRIPATVLTALAKLRILFFYDLFSLLVIFVVLYLMRGEQLEVFVTAKVTSEFVCGVIFFIFMGRFMKETKKFIFLLFIFFFVGFISIFSAVLVKYVAVGINFLFLEVLVSGVLYLMLLSVVFIVLYFSGLKKKPQIMHIMFLISAPLKN